MSPLRVIWPIFASSEPLCRRRSPKLVALTLTRQRRHAARAAARIRACQPVIFDAGWYKTKPAKASTAKRFWPTCWPRQRREWPPARRESRSHLGSCAARSRRHARLDRPGQPVPGRVVRPGDVRALPSAGQAAADRPRPARDGAQASDRCRTAAMSFLSAQRERHIDLIASFMAAAICGAACSRDWPYSRYLIWSVQKRSSRMSAWLTRENSSVVMPPICSTVSTCFS